MKNLGWQLFIALLLADIIAFLMLKLMVRLQTVLIIGGIVFVILSLVFFFGQNARQRIKKREEQAVAKIADLQDQVEAAIHKKENSSTKTNESSVENS